MLALAAGSAATGVITVIERDSHLVLLEIANIGQITSNPVKIDRNHQDIATPHHLGVPGTFLGQMWKINFFMMILILGGRFLESHLWRILNIGQHR